MTAPPPGVPARPAARPANRPTNRPARWRVWLLAASRRTPIAPPSAAVGPVAVAAAGGALLAIGEGRPLPAALTPPIVLLAHLAVDRRRAFHLPAVFANLLGLAAAGLALTELSSGEIEARLLFGAHLLVYLTWIISLQRKSFKVCWSLIALSVLQVAVASVLTAGAQFGIGLGGFLLLTLWALTNLSARWPDADRASAAPRRAERRADRRPRSRWAPGGRRRFGRGGAPAPIAASVVRDGRVGPAEVRGPGRAVAAATAVAVVIGLTAFLLTPRMWLSRRPPIDPTRTAGVSTAYTGFTGEVRLGVLGEILESQAPAFEVEVDRPRLGWSLAENDAERVFGTAEPLFRGRALSRYEAGHWTDSLSSRDDRRLPTTPPPWSDTTAVERYRLLSLGDEVLMHVGSAAAVAFEERPGEQARYRETDGLLLRPRSLSAAATVEYAVYSATPPEDPDALPLTERERRRLRRNGPREPLSPFFRKQYVQLPGELPAAAAAAEAALADAAVGEDDEESDRAGRVSARRTADLLTRYLRDSGRFRYSLDLSVQDTGVDLVEDFLLNKRVGHCEYFATALALMLRDRGVPSRVVTGFKGGDLNPATRRFEVQQRHAHAWVEAYVGGRWETYDPTPAAARTRSVADSGPQFTLLSQLLGGAESVWGEYVVRMSLERQRATFGRPLRDAWEAVRHAAASLPLRPGEGGGVRFDGRAGAVFAAIALVLVALGWAGRGLLSRRWRRRREERARAEAVRFWRRFIKLAAVRGVIRGTAETPAEFAARAADSWHGKLDGDLGSLPAAAAADLYAVRFGGTALPPDRLTALDRALDRLENRLQTA